MERGETSDRSWFDAAPDMLKVGEAARILNVSADTVANYYRRGLLTEHRTAGGWRLIPKEEVLALREAGGVRSGNPDRKPARKAKRP